MKTELLREFDCCGKSMVVIRLENSAHILTKEEWEKIYGKLHPERFVEKNRKQKSA